MELVANWRRVLTRGWSAWCTYVASVMAVAQWSQFLIGFVDLMPLIIATLALGLALRVFKQTSVSGE